MQNTLARQLTGGPAHQGEKSQTRAVIAARRQVGSAEPFTDPELTFGAKHLLVFYHHVARMVGELAQCKDLLAWEFRPQVETPHPNPAGGSRGLHRQRRRDLQRAHLDTASENVTHVGLSAPALSPSAPRNACRSTSPLEPPNCLAPVERSRS